MCAIWDPRCHGVVWLNWTDHLGKAHVNLGTSGWILGLVAQRTGLSLSTVWKRAWADTALKHVGQGNTAGMGEKMETEAGSVWVRVMTISRAGPFSGRPFVICSVSVSTWRWQRSNKPGPVPLAWAGISSCPHYMPTVLSRTLRAWKGLAESVGLREEEKEGQSRRHSHLTAPPHLPGRAHTLHFWGETWEPLQGNGRDNFKWSSGGGGHGWDPKCSLRNHDLKNLCHTKSPFKSLKSEAFSCNENFTYPQMHLSKRMLLQAP